MTSYWWDAFPGRLEYEHASLQAAGIGYQVDPVAEQAGVAQWRITQIGAEPVDLTATFPDLYPFLRPSVRLADDGRLRLTHHVHPFSGDLCLLGRSTAEWQPDKTLAWLLTTQLPKALTAGQAPAAAVEGPDHLARLELPQAEPWTEYYSCYADGAMILVDSAWALPESANQGSLDLRLSRLDLTTPPQYLGVGFLQGAVFTVRDQDDQVVGEISGQNFERFITLPIAGRWVRLPAPIEADDPEEILQAVKATTPYALDAPWQPGPPGWELQAIGLTFPEERAHRSLGDGWVFLIRVRPAIRTHHPSARKHGRQRGLRQPLSKTTVHLVRAGYGGRTDMAARVPELAGLHDRKVLVFGVGALGSTVVEHLARAGLGHLTLVDRDYLEPGNLVRHAAGLAMVGWSKAAAAGHIALNVGPDVAPLIMEASIGAPRSMRRDDERNEVDIWIEHIDQADLVLDCTAEKGVQYALSWLARQRGKPYLAASATNGGWGGRVVRLVPQPRRACWACLEYALEDGSIPVPPAAPESTGVQPVGCADPTFTGSGFDLAEVALHATRTAVATLQANQIGGYPDSGHDISVLTLRTDDGLPIPPVWHGHSLPVHPSCSGPH